ncbi:MAG: MgtC/SapB family protein [Bacteroidetes bacterium]|nr:MgtC/SapB family protein [Bacteroidota bacterium]
MGLNAFEWTVELRFIIALMLGFLVGLERESIKVDRKLVFGGVRTHPIISMFGFGCAWLFKLGATFMLPSGLLAVAALTGIAYIAKIRTDRFGTTSEVSALLTFITGALAMLVDIWIAMAMGIVNTILLSEKAMLESYVERLSKVEFLATVKFLLVTLIILPVLPDQEYTQFNINPVKVWQIVIIVSTLGFVGYLLEKNFGAKVGLWLSGIFGGIVSSTAMTISVGRMAQRNPSRCGTALQSALLASSMMYIRVLVLVWFINSTFIPDLWYRLVILSAAGIVLSLKMFQKEKESKESEISELQNPFEIRPAIGFAILFVVLSVVTGFIRSTLGNSGLLGLSAIIGVTDIDPFILSLIQGPGSPSNVFISAIMLAILSNTITKAIYFGSLSPANRKETAIKFSILALVHIPFIVL